MIVAQQQQVDFADVLGKIVLPLAAIILGAVWVAVQMLERKIKEAKDDLNTQLKDLRDTLDKRLDRLQTDTERKTEQLQVVVKERIDKQDDALRALERSLADLQSKGSVQSTAYVPAPYTSMPMPGASPVLAQTPESTLLPEITRVARDILTRAAQLIMTQADAAAREVERREKDAAQKEEDALQAWRQAQAEATAARDAWQKAQAESAEARDSWQKAQAGPQQEEDQSEPDDGTNRDAQGDHGTP